jgi:hypothetical protein
MSKARDTVQTEAHRRKPETTRAPLDTALNTLDETVIGGGIGPREAEHANREPVGAADTMRRRAEQPARDADAHEAKQQPAIARTQRRRAS